MRLSQFHLATIKEVPTDAEIISHQLMLRAGMIRKLAAGVYTWSPLGLRVLRKVEGIIREEMENAGAIEMVMPSIQPRQLWEESGRWNQFGDQLLKLKDRKQNDFCYGPTHEEVITDFARSELKSYKQLPITFFQSQTKFRDEIRPRFGIMRSREFVMKDAYSFDMDMASLDRSYQAMHKAYENIFNRLGLIYRCVQADNGAIGGHKSQEFQVLADSGEDLIVWSDGSDYAANIEKAETFPSEAKAPAPSQELTRVNTPNQTTIEQLSDFLGVAPASCLKTILLKGQDGLVALCLRGDHTLNEIKASKLPEINGEFTLAEDDDITSAIETTPGFIGPVELPQSIPVIVDYSAAILADFVCGGNQADTHFTGANWHRDARITRAADLRNVVEGDVSPDGKGKLQIAHGIEVGHIFQLGSKYAQSMGFSVLDANGKAHTPLMGCYGIGVTRIVGAAIEQSHDEKGIIWPETIAPWTVAICPIGGKRSPEVSEKAEQIYQYLKSKGIDAVLDDRGLRPGNMFSDIELIGIPHRIVISKKSLEADVFEYRYRRSENNNELKLNEIVKLITNSIQ